MAADAELLSKKEYNIWEIVEEFLTALSNYREFLKEYEAPNYPLDVAMTAMNAFGKVERAAFTPVKDMLESLIHDQEADEQLKKRVTVKMSFGIRPEAKD